MRIFGGDRMKNLMRSLKLPEDTPIENKVISKSIESAQRRVEGNNFDIRKHLVEYDDVINHHRHSIYGRRREILALGEHEPKEGERSLQDIILQMVEAEIEQLVSFHTVADYVKDWDLKEIKESIATIFPIEGDFMEKLDSIANDASKLDKIKLKTDIIEHIVESAKNTYEKMAQMAKEAGFDWREVERSVLLRTMDTLWMDHLEVMDYMRRGIGLRGYGQRDPLVEYKKESFRLYTELLGLIQKQVVYSIYKVGSLQDFVIPQTNLNNITVSAPAKTMGEGSSSITQVFTERKVKDAEGNVVGRNDLCPCGSGKKYKKCGLLNTPEHQELLSKK
jgi:preprotein translocase subunit SecA